jgi:hypothetical protein
VAVPGGLGEVRTRRARECHRYGTAEPSTHVALKVYSMDQLIAK